MSASMNFGACTLAHAHHSDEDTEHDSYHDSHPFTILSS